MLESDRELLDAFRRGERAALTRVFDLYVDDVARTARAGVLVAAEGGPVRLGADLDEPEVEAIVQETFARAFSHAARASYDGLRPYGAYLATIVRNLLIDRGRALSKAGWFSVDASTLETDVPDPARVLEARELGDLVRRFEDALGEPDRSVFRLRLGEERSYRETGASTGLSEMQVRRRDAQLKEAFLAFLRGHGFLREAKATTGSRFLPRRRAE